MTDENIRDGENQDDKQTEIGQPVGNDHSAFLPDEELLEKLPDELDADERTAIIATRTDSNIDQTPTDSSAAFDFSSDADLSVSDKVSEISRNASNSNSVADLNPQFDASSVDNPAVNDGQLPTWYVIFEGQSNHLMGRHGAAAESFQEVLSRTREGIIGRGAWVWLIATYMETGREAEARAETEKFLQQNPNYSLKSYATRFKRSFKDPSVLDRPFELMREAGLPQ